MAHSIETSFVVITVNLHASRSDKLLMVLILLDLSTLSITRLSYPSSQVLELVAQHGLYLTWRDSLIKWHGGDLFHAETPLVPHMVQWLVLFCSSPILGEVICSHVFSYHCYANDTQLILSFPPSDTYVSAVLLACQAYLSSWMAAYQLKLSHSKTQLL